MDSAISRYFCAFPPSHRQRLKNYWKLIAGEVLQMGKHFSWEQQAPDNKNLCLLPYKNRFCLRLSRFSGTLRGAFTSKTCKRAAINYSSILWNIQKSSSLSVLSGCRNTSKRLLSRQLLIILSPNMRRNALDRTPVSTGVISLLLSVAKEKFADYRKPFPRGAAFQKAVE